jgi:hypothetical protein
MSKDGSRRKNASSMLKLRTFENGAVRENDLAAASLHISGSERFEGVCNRLRANRTRWVGGFSRGLSIKVIPR